MIVEFKMNTFVGLLLPALLSGFQAIPCTLVVSYNKLLVAGCWLLVIIACPTDTAIFQLICKLQW